jgi:hypothetical protein
MPIGVVSLHQQSDKAAPGHGSSRALQPPPAAQKLERLPQKTPFSCGAGYEIGESKRCGHPIAIRLAYPLRSDSSLYDAMRAIIGSELRSKLDVPKAMPSYLDDLLKELDDRLGSDQLEGSTHSERPANC